MKILLTLPMNRPPDQVHAMNDTGLGYLAAFCKEKGFEIELLSWNVNLDIDEFRNKLLEIHPDIVGVKVFTDQLVPAYNTLKTIKETLPSTVTIIGGPHPSTSRPHDIFSEFDDVLDFAIAGDGEVSFSIICKNISLAQGKPDVKELNEVPGLIYKSNNEIKFNAPHFDTNLDILPPLDWSIQQPAWFKDTNGASSRKVLVCDSRGCPAKCGHCMSGLISGSKVRKRSISSLCNEIEELVRKYNVSLIDFTGNALLSNVDYLEELCNRLIEFNSHLKWNCTGAAFDRNLHNSKLLNLMKRSGCNIIHFGIESGNPDVSKRICKPLSIEEYSEIVEIVHKCGIKPLGYFMFGFPDETPKQMGDTVKYALSLPFYSLSFQICLPYPGTLCYTHLLKQEGIDKVEWSTYDFHWPKLLPCSASVSHVYWRVIQTKILNKSQFASKLYRLLP